MIQVLAADRKMVRCLAAPQGPGARNVLVTASRKQGLAVSSDADATWPPHNNHTLDGWAGI